jgi:hypothetical protein
MCLLFHQQKHMQYTHMVQGKQQQHSLKFFPLQIFDGHGGGEMNFVHVEALFCIGVDIVGFLDGE